MQRRRQAMLAGAALLAGGWPMDELSAAAGALLPGLKPSPRMPVLFLGHGSPLNVIEDTGWRRGWQALGREFGQRWPQPQLILCISAHWLTRGWWLTGMERPRTIHDFGGFPDELFAQQYPAPGAPRTVAALSKAFSQPPVGVDAKEWGFDHGTWSVLKPMFPRADIPVVQLSLNWDRPPAEHFALGRQLRRLREQGVLIVGSGNIVHNLRAIQRNVPDGQTHDWSREFDAATTRLIDAGALDKLADFQSLGEIARLSHPTYDHYLPLLHAAGAAEPGEPVRYFNTGFQAASISMRSVIWG